MKKIVATIIVLLFSVSECFADVVGWTYYTEDGKEMIYTPEMHSRATYYNPKLSVLEIILRFIPFILLIIVIVVGIIFIIKRIRKNKNNNG